MLSAYFESINKCLLNDFLPFRSGLFLQVRCAHFCSPSPSPYQRASLVLLSPRASCWGLFMDPLCLRPLKLVPFDDIGD